ncbi:MAG: UDP-N-acetylmuramate dehydrogenase [Lautropia sp.]|nr:UDP-N-acetylmuramate dehydrogenase [Lautropia sp.]
MAPARESDAGVPVSAGPQSPPVPAPTDEPGTLGGQRRMHGQRSPLTVWRQLDLKPLNTFGIAATADSVHTLDDIGSVDEVLAALRQQQDAAGQPPLILSGGSNLLLARDLTEPVLLVRTRGRQLVDRQGDEVLIDVAAGEVWHDIVRWTLDEGYYGLENLALIPGRAGAAPWQNIGAYGVEAGDCIDSVAAIHLNTGERRRFSRADCAFAYRQSFFKTAEGRNWLIVSVRLRLSTRFEPRLAYAELAAALGVPPASMQQGSDGSDGRTAGHRPAGPTARLSAQLVADTVEAIRRRKLPDPAVLGNAGSFFHNPVVSAETVERLRSQHPDMPAHPTTPAVADSARRQPPSSPSPTEQASTPAPGAQVASHTSSHVAPHPVGTSPAPVAPGDLSTAQTSFKLSAGWLIDQCGWKGYRDGDAGVSPHHALVLVNHGNATGQQILHLAERIQQSVFERFGVPLHPEPVIIR